MGAAGLRWFKPYPAYKNSDVEWLGKIPAHWEVKRLRFVAALNPPASEVRGLAPDTEVSFVPMEAVGEYGGLDLSTAKPLADVGSGYTYFRDDDVVVAKITPCFENGKGARAAKLLNGIAFGTTELHVLRATEALDEQFLFYLTLSDAFRRLGEAEMYGAGGQKRVPESFVENLRHPIPSIPEQRAIAAFLDRETERIDELVMKKERVIELLQERRAALITRAVTKGLDANVPMKDSGIEWLGKMPAHWEVKRLWHLTPPDRRIMYGIVLPGPHVEDGVPIVKGGDVSSERLRLNRLSRTTHEIESGYAKSRLRGGDLVYAIRGSIGEVAIVPNELEGANLTQDAARVAYTAAVDGLWLLYALRSSAVFAQLEAGAVGATIRGINIRDLKRVSIPVPPLIEQHAIAVFLDRAIKKIDDLIAKIHDANDRLKELRTNLISAAVTGKIDIREVPA
jgi:type I restriction enzyme S subunit